MHARCSSAARRSRRRRPPSRQRARKSRSVEQLQVVHASTCAGEEGHLTVRAPTVAFALLTARCGLNTCTTYCMKRPGFTWPRPCTGCTPRRPACASGRPARLNHVSLPRTIQAHTVRARPLTHENHLAKLSSNECDRNLADSVSVRNSVYSRRLHELLSV